MFVVAGLGCGRTLALDRKLTEVPEHPPTASCPGAHEPGYDALQNLRAALKAENKTSDRALVIGPGEGTTATRTLAHILKDAFGLRVLHWHLFDREGSKKHAADALLHELARVPPAEYHQIDWISLMEPFDAVLDTPIPNIFPFLYAAFPNARIVHTVRAADEWVHTRTKRAKLLAPVPFSGFFRQLKFNATSGFDGNVDRFERPTTSAMHTSALLFSAHNTFVRCSVPSDRYLQLNAFAGDLCSPTLLDSLRRTLSRSTTALGSAVEYRPLGCERDGKHRVDPIREGTAPGERDGLPSQSPGSGANSR